MTPDERQNTLTWLNGEIRGSYAIIIKESFPALVGLPIDDDGHLLSVVLTELADEELEAILRLGEEQLAAWIRGQVEEAVHGWFRDEAEEVLCMHVGDTLMDYPQITDDDLRTSLNSGCN